MVDAAPPTKRSRLRRALLVVGIVIGGLLLAFGGLAFFAVHRPLHTRGSGALAAGATAKAFTLPDQTGKPVALADLTAHGPAVLVFYRGYW